MRICILVSIMFILPLLGASHQGAEPTIPLVLMPERSNSTSSPPIQTQAPHLRRRSFPQPQQPDLGSSPYPPLPLPAPGADLSRNGTEESHINQLSHPEAPDDSDSQAEMGWRYAGPMDNFASKPESGLRAFFKRKPLTVAVLVLLVFGFLWSQAGPATPSLTSFKPQQQSQNHQALAYEDEQDQGQPRPSSQECKPLPGKPDHQYALMIDAGSTGSRIHI